MEHFSLLFIFSHQSFLFSGLFVFSRVLFFYPTLPPFQLRLETSVIATRNLAQKLLSVFLKKTLWYHRVQKENSEKEKESAKKERFLISQTS